MFSVLRYKTFRWIWAASLVSNVGNWMEAVGQSWLVQQQTASPFMVELLAASEFVPHALLVLAAGALADRYDRRKLLLAGQIAMMALGAVLAVLTHLGHATPWVVIALSFAEGAAWASVMPAWQALVPALVPRDELPSAIALNSAQFNTARLLGPMLAGTLLSTAGAALVFDVNVVSFLGIVLVLALVRVPSAPVASAPTTGGSLKLAGGAGTALKWALHEPGPRRLIVGVFAFSIFSAPVQGLLPTMADQVLHVGARGYGAMLSSLGAGAIAGALTLARLPRSYPRHHLIPLSMLGFSLGHLLGGALAHGLGVRAGVILTSGALACFSLWSVRAREPAIDAMDTPPPPARGFRAALWEALTAASHRAQEIEPGVHRGAAEPAQD